MRNVVVINHNRILNLVGQIPQSRTKNQADDRTDLAQLALNGLAGLPDLCIITFIWIYRHVYTLPDVVTFEE
ncbi:hypothetical protein D3C71_1785650 [compost metagenome]